jgi:hypothetical protein
MSKQLRLLQIEDSESDAEMMLRLLRQAGFEVTARRVDDAEGLRQALAEATWDVALADYVLPGFDAPGALRIMQECGQDIPCIVVSGKKGEDTAVEMMRSGAHDYLTKDNLNRLAPAVERELADAELRRQFNQAHRELRASEEHLALAVQATQLGTFDYEPRTGRLIWSKCARQHFGLLSEAEATWDTFQQALHPGDRERALQTVQAALRRENGGDYADEFRVIGIEDGQERWLASRGRVFFDTESQPLRFVGVLLNTTERKRLEQQLLQAQKLESVGRMAGAIAHDFNSLMTTINGYAHLVLAELTPESTLRGSMEELAKAAMRAAGLTRQLVAFSRRQAVEPKTIVLNALVREHENAMRQTVGGNIQLELALDPDAGTFRADPAQIGRALLNLAENARDAMPSGGKLTVATARLEVDEDFARTQLYVDPGPYAVLAVTDTGTGMSAEVKAHLYEPFYTTKEQGKGAGLGLATVYGIVVNQSGGAIWVSSEPGKGTTFKLFFPCFTTEAPQPTMRTEIEPSRGETILLAEDESSVRRYTREILQRAGYVVLEAANGMEALATAQSHPGTIHLLLTDIIMPTLGGVDLAERFTVQYPGVPVLFISGYSDQIMLHWNELSAYVQKPFTKTELLAQVRELLDRSSPGLPPPAGTAAAT